MKIIAIEGLDGSGKTTQVNLLKKIYGPEKCSFIKFPYYDTPTGQKILEYLNGDSNIDMWSLVRLYASNKIEGFMEFRKNNPDFLKKDYLITDRYSASNMIYQCAKLYKSNYDNDMYNIWIHNLTKIANSIYSVEHEEFGVPEADKVIYLDMDIRVSNKLLSSRYNYDESKKDNNERNIKYLIDCRTIALELAPIYNWEVVKCYNDHTLEPLAISTINKKIVNIINKL